MQYDTSLYDDSRLSLPRTNVHVGAPYEESATRFEATEARVSQG